MPLSESIDSYLDLRPALDQALDAPLGIRITYETGGKAQHQMQRMFKLRLLDRSRSRNIYTEADPEFNTSPYDVLDFSRDASTITIKKAVQPKIEVISA